MLRVFVLFFFIECHGYQRNPWNPGYNYQKTPQEVMVDLINKLGLKILAIHNENNKNNIAISPYGAASVLVTLAEGVYGDALVEIQKSANIPQDLPLVRVGLRDIHRHLKSYFIPEEGFLAGLTLSHENVTLRSEFQDILRFYGYDVSAFNNALYPDLYSTTTETNPTSTSSTEINTEEIILSTTEKERTVRSESTTFVPSTIISTESPAQTSTQPVSTTTENTAYNTNDITITTSTANTYSTSNTNVNNDEIINTSTDIISTTRSTIYIENNTSESTTRVEVESDANSKTTTSIINDATSTISTISNSTENEIETTTTNTETNLASSTISSIVIPTIPAIAEDSTSEATTQINNSIASESVINDEIRTTTTILNKISTIEENSASTGSTTTSSRIVDETITTSSSELIEISTIENNESDQTTSSNGDSISTSTADFLSTTGLISNEVTENPDRSKRSVLDYIIARYYDDHVVTHRPPPYIPDSSQLTFLIDGKYTETNINFMTYDTVLPFYYVPHLNTLALSFPLDSTKYYLLLLLPVDDNGIDKLICDLNLNASLKYIIENLRYTHVKAVIPSFMLKGYVILTPTLQKMGIRRVFEPRQADFSKMTADRELYVTNIEQAVTVTIRNYVDPNTIMSNNDYRNLQQYDPIYFKADHPFLYFVMDSEIHVTLMAGKIINPLNSRIR